MTHPAPVQATPPHRPLIDDADFTLHVGDALDVLRTLPDESVHCVVTSPPYWGLRDYGTGTWEGGDPDCDHVARRGGHLKDSAASTRGGANQVAESQTVPFKGDCGKCGATRTDQQLGLEPTPEAYVARMVEVFREVKRVLRRDGTCWLNLGDSYAGSWSGNSMRPEGGEQRAGGPGFQPLDERVPARSGNVPAGLKPKDLVMVPARLAQALQAPYYTGEIKSETDRAWLAAIVDGEGCIYISRSKTGAITGRGRQYTRTQDAFDAGLSVVNTSQALLERCVAITGLGKVRKSHNRGTQAYEWRIYSSKARQVLRELYPHLVAKQDQARLAIACPPSGDKATEAWKSLKVIHQGETACIDFAPPEGMWERGWFLRSEIIWAKLCRTQCPNPSQIVLPKAMSRCFS